MLLSLGSLPSPWYQHIIFLVSVYSVFKKQIINQLKQNMEMDLATGKFVSPFVFHRRKLVTGVWNETRKCMFLNYSSRLSEQEFQTRIEEISSVCSVDKKGVSRMKEWSYWSEPDGGGGCWAFRHVFGIQPATIFSKNSDSRKQACEPYLQLGLPSVDVIGRLIQFLQFALLKRESQLRSQWDVCCNASNIWKVFFK